MTPDVAQTNLKPYDAINYDQYSDKGVAKSFGPPPEGRYTGRIGVIKDDGTDVLSDSNDFGRTAAGYLKVRLDPITVIDAKDYAIKYQQPFSSKKYSNREGSQVLDFLRACGIAARPQNEAELRAAVKMASGRTFGFQLVWEAWNKDAQESYNGMDSGHFKDDPNNAGQKQPFVVDPYDETKRWWANGRVRYFISALSK